MTSLFGRVKSAGLDRFGFRVTVAAISEPALGFVLITFAGPALCEHAWRAGDRVSVRTPDDQLRNYTPFEWNATEGRARILGAGRASGPGTRYLASLAVGDTVQLIGPKKSVDLGSLGQAPIIVGDETVIGLCAAWAGLRADAPATVLLEAVDTAACHTAAHAVGVTPSRVVHDRTELIATVVEHLRADATRPLVVSGRAQTIAAVRRALKDARRGGGHVKAKAYWDENRAGLD